MTWLTLIMWILLILLLLTISSIFLMKKIKKSKKSKKNSKDSEDSGNNIISKENNLENLSSKKVNIIFITSVDGTPVFDETFNAIVEEDSFDGVRYMVNADNKFKELYPEKDVELFANINLKGKNKQEKLNNLNVLIGVKKDLLKTSLKNPTRNVNECDLEDEINILNIYKKELSLESEGSPLYVGENGMKNFFFKKTSGETIPLRWDIAGNSIYNDMAYKKKFEAIARSNLLTKYSSKVHKTVDAGVIWLIVINVVWTIFVFAGTVILIGKYNVYDTMYDESKLIELKTKAEVATAFCSENIAQTSQNLVQISEAQQKAFKTQESFFNKLTGSSDKPVQTLPDK